ncbi:YbaN family protein [Thalassotalea litorea]|uniref:YbaN family protein n=1 Tax=Thalassotalea litorea TaxID=2020715 RepID=UPI0037367436
MLTRYAYLLLGLFMVGLATLGAILPGLPTTPFVLVAAACFAKSSPKLHCWLRNNALFGPLIVNWQQHRCISRRTKIIAVIMILVFGSYSLFFALQDTWLKIFVGIFLAIGLTVVLSLKTCPTTVSNTSK